MTKINITFPSKPTIFVIDDNPEILNALRCLLESVELNVECFESSMSFLENYSPSPYGCIIADVRMPIMGGIRLFEQLKLLKNRLPVIILTGYGDIAMAVNAMKIGIADFICKPFDAQYLLEQVQKFIDLSLNQFSLDEAMKSYNDRFADLSKREQQVMKLVIAGKLNKQIAKELSIANSTVEFHRSRVMKKMGTKNLAQLIRISERVSYLKK